MACAKMPDVNSRQSLDQQIDHVRECIEKCMQMYMNKRETVNFLAVHRNIEPAITRIVWVRLERENPEFFRAYYVRLAVQDQIMEFNRLLSAHVELMRQSELLAVNANQFDSNRSYTTTQQISTPNAVQGIMQQKPENMNHIYASTNNGLSIGTQQAFDQLSIQASSQQAFDQFVLPQNMFVSQNSNVVSDISLGVPNNFMEPNPPIVDASMSLFGNGGNYAQQFCPSRVFLEQQQQAASAPEYPVNSISSSGLPLSSSGNGQYLDEFLSKYGFLEQYPSISTNEYPLDSSSCTGNVEMLEPGSSGSLRNPFFE